MNPHKNIPWSLIKYPLDTLKLLTSFYKKDNSKILKMKKGSKMF